MYGNEPVMIPDKPGKISIRTKNGSEYVRYLVRRRYDPDRKFNIPEWKIIGIRIPSVPGMMLPNGNYYQYFSGEENMNEEQKETAKNYGRDKRRFTTLRDLFDQLYYEFQAQSRRKPDDPVNGYKAMKINSILEPLREMMSGEDYGRYLDLIETEGTDTAKTYSDAALLLTQYKGAIRRYCSERF